MCWNMKKTLQQSSPDHMMAVAKALLTIFKTVPGFKLAFRKRVLHAGSAIGYHLQKEDEVYYIVSGSGEMKMNGERFAVNAGDGILTRPGSSHGIQPTGNNDLSLIIVYEEK